MNVIEKMRELVQSFPKIDEVCGSLHVDFSDLAPASYGLSSVGDTLISEDVLGGQQRSHSFLLYAVYSSINDFERLSNSSALLELAVWLEEQTGAPVETAGRRGEIIRITTANGQLYAVSDNDNFSGWQYQLSITAEYTAAA